ncbi:MAG TPA: alpha-D-ribose 1-methylphosphonate 5-triphosphate diphosphatase, partial [Thermomicrobiales bacterium]|nr:alpha-D-ribose 1-methylphosphonate 5-triphosphate diphosphatase [Thermomicrobiales bacterium]
MSNLTVTNATVVLPDHILEETTVRIDDGIITAIETGSVSSLTEQETIVDADGAYLIPGVVDLHNDNLEFEIHPRANANLPLHFALSTMERRLAGAGVTTEFHAVSFQNMRGKGRTITDAEHKAEFLAAFDDDDRRAVRHNILHRLDVRTPTSIDSALPSLRRVKRAYASLNDHTPGQGQYRDVDRLIKMAAESQAMRNAAPTEREWYLERMRQGLADTEAVPAYYRHLQDELVHTPVILSTHDDDTIEKVDAQLALGATISEFPITFEAAERARAGGMVILVGAPNIVRGGSQSGNLSAIELAAAGLADAIVADYHAPCLIASAFRLVNDGVRDLPAAIAMITR